MLTAACCPAVRSFPSKLLSVVPDPVIPIEAVPVCIKVALNPTGNADGIVSVPADEVFHTMTSPLSVESNVYVVPVCELIAPAPTLNPLSAYKYDPPVIAEFADIPDVLCINPLNVAPEIVVGMAIVLALNEIILEPVLLIPL